MPTLQKLLSKLSVLKNVPCPTNDAQDPKQACQICPSKTNWKFKNLTFAGISASPILSFIGETSLSAHQSVNFGIPTHRWLAGMLETEGGALVSPWEELAELEGEGADNTPTNALYLLPPSLPCVPSCLGE